MSRKDAERRIAELEEQLRRAREEAARYKEDAASPLAAPHATVADLLP
jgi:hypothetical protein